MKVKLIKISRVQNGIVQNVQLYIIVLLYKSIFLLTSIKKGNHSFQLVLFKSTNYGENSELLFTLKYLCRKKISKPTLASILKEIIKFKSVNKFSLTE